MAKMKIINRMCTLTTIQKVVWLVLKNEVLIIVKICFFLRNKKQTSFN